MIRLGRGRVLSCVSRGPAFFPSGGALLRAVVPALGAAKRATHR